MARYRIICTRQEPASAPPSHQHIVAVGTGTEPRHYTNLWTLDQVLDAMHRGDSFFTQGEHSGRIAEVEAYHCTYCRRTAHPLAPRRGDGQQPGQSLAMRLIAKAHAWPRKAGPANHPGLLVLLGSRRGRSELAILGLHVYCSLCAHAVRQITRVDSK